MFANDDGEDNDRSNTWLHANAANDSIFNVNFDELGKDWTVPLSPPYDQTFAQTPLLPIGVYPEFPDEYTSPLTVPTVSSPASSSSPEPLAFSSASSTSSSHSSPLPSTDSNAANITADRIANNRAAGCAIATESKRDRHRQLDANRRNRENAAVDRLRHLMRAVDGTSHTQADRATTLHSAADTIAKLMATVETLRREQDAGEVVSNKRPRRVEPIERTNDETSDTNVDTAVATAHTEVTRAMITRSLRTDNFFAELFMNASTIQVVFNADTGVCLFVNDIFVNTTGYSREMIQGGKGIIPREQFLAMESPRNIYDETKNIRYPDGTVVKKKHVEQPRESMTLFKQLYRQQLPVIQTTLLTYDVKGQITPITVRVWLSKSRKSYNVDGAQDNSVTLVHMNSDMRALYAPERQCF